jgi:hypothetical protein
MTNGRTQHPNAVRTPIAGAGWLPQATTASFEFLEQVYASWAHSPSW